MSESKQKKCASLDEILLKLERVEKEYHEKLKEVNLDLLLENEAKRKNDKQN